MSETCLKSNVEVATSESSHEFYYYFLFGELGQYIYLYVVGSQQSN